jgi:hypothetical protein
VARHHRVTVHPDYAYNLKTALHALFFPKAVTHKLIEMHLHVMIPQPPNRFLAQTIFSVARC